MNFFRPLSFPSVCFYLAVAMWVFDQINYWRSLAVNGFGGTMYFREREIPWLLAIAGVGWLAQAISYRQGMGETVCRKCAHILRGLSEPRCPECGERI